MALSCTGLASSVMVDVSVVDTAVTTTAMEPHVWHFLIALLATGNSLDVEK